MILLAVIAVALIALALFGLLGFALLGSVSRKQHVAERNAESLLDEAFDGRDLVTIHLNMATMKYETVIAGATARGYRLEHQADNQYGPHTLMFRKA